MDGKTARGASSPAKPALHSPEPLSQTKAVVSSSHMAELRDAGIQKHLEEAEMKGNVKNYMQL